MTMHVHAIPERPVSRPATADLREEHEVILRAIGLLERVADRLAAGRHVEAGAVDELVELLRAFADRCHHGKEEEHLFPAMRAKGAAGPLAVFLEEHDEGRGYLRTLAGNGPAAQRAAAAWRYVGLLRDHIQRENDVLFPMADELFDAGEHARLAAAYAEVEARLGDLHARALATLTRLDATIPST